MDSIITYIKKYLSLNNLLFVIAFLLFLNILTHLNSLSSYISILVIIIRPLLIGYFLAYLLYPLVSFIEKFARSRILSLCLVCLVIIGLCLIFFSKLYPIIYQNILDLINFLLKYTDIINQGITQYHISIENMQEIIQQYLVTPTTIETFFTAFSTILKYFGNILTYLIFTFYFVIKYESINHQIKKYSSMINQSIPIYLSAINKQIRQYLKVYVTLMFIQFLLNFIILRILHHPYHAIISILAGISSLLPYIGPIAVSFLTILTALPLSITKLIILIIALVIISNIDSYVITPRIYSKQMNIPSFLILFTMLTASKIFGFLGVIFAIPSMIVLKTILVTYQKQK